MKLPLSLVGLVSLLSVTAHAGPASSGGGPAVVCRGDDHKITSAKLLDLFEGEVRFNLKISQSTAPMDEQVRAALKNLSFNQPFVSEIEETLLDLKKHIVFLPPNVSLYPGVDLGGEYGVVVEDGCSLELVGFYESDNTLKIAQPVFYKLSPTDQAAFWLHEAIYKMARYYKSASNSAASRHLNALIFTANPKLEEIKSLIDEVYEYQMPLYINANLPIADFTIVVRNPSSDGFGYYFNCLGEKDPQIHRDKNNSFTHESILQIPIKGPCSSLQLQVLDRTLRGDVKYGNEVLLENVSLLGPSGGLFYRIHRK